MPDKSPQGFMFQRRDVRQRRSRSANPEVFRRRLATVGHLLETDLGPLIQSAQSRLLDSRNVNKDVFAAIVRLDKAKALRRVEPFYYASRHFSSPGCLWKHSSALFRDESIEQTLFLPTRYRNRYRNKRSTAIRPHCRGATAALGNINSGKPN